MVTVAVEELLNLLANETRRKILTLLASRPMFITEISEELNIGRKAILEHLSYLEKAGIIESRLEKNKIGRPRKYYTLSSYFSISIEVRSNGVFVSIHDIRKSNSDE